MEMAGAGIVNYRDVEAEMQEGVDEFDRRLAALRGELTPASVRRSRIAALAASGATEGERAAARAALERFDLTHSEMERMQRGGNWIE